jgi:hypothetical protein
MFIPIYGLFDRPAYLINEYWDVYLLFVFLPYGIAGILLFFSSKKRRKNGDDEGKL